MSEAPDLFAGAAEDYHRRRPAYPRRRSTGSSGSTAWTAAASFETDLAGRLRALSCGDRFEEAIVVTIHSLKKPA